MTPEDRAGPDMSALLQRDYWLIRSTPMESTTAADVAHGAGEHVQWLLGLEARGIVVMSGPLLSGPGVRPGAGITVVRADTEDDAVAIGNADPFVLSGLRTFEVFRWRVNEGTIDVRISLGTGTFDLR